MKIKLNTVLFTFIFCLVIGNHSYAQQSLNQVNIVSFVVKSKLPTDVNSWSNIPASILLIAQKMPTAQIQGVKLVVQIKSGNSKICGNSVQSAPVMDVFSVKTFSTNELLSLFAQCPKLTATNYTICAQFYNVDNYPISKEFCRDFMVGDFAITYSAPQNIAPANDKKFTETTINTPIVFRWTPVLPKPKEIVIYKLRIWQLMQGQTAAQAIKANEPLVEKEVTNINQAIVTNLIITPCQLPYLCSFVWNVQAIDKDGKPIGKNNGMGELFSFKLK